LRSLPSIKKYFDDYFVFDENEKEELKDESKSTEGFGSIWNQNSFFFEEKNFSTYAKNFLGDKIALLSEEKNGV